MMGSTHLDVSSFAPQAIDNINITESDDEWLNHVEKESISERKGEIMTNKDSIAHHLLSGYYQAYKKKCCDKKRHGWLQYSEKETGRIRIYGGHNNLQRQEA